MNKLLLSFAFVAVSASYVNAESVVLQVADATDYEGSYAEEKRKDDGTLQEAAKWQPINSFKISGYTISASKGAGSTEPAVYLPASDKPDGSTQLRVYKNNTVSIAAPENASISSVTYVLDGKTEEVAMDGSFADGVYTWTNGTGSNIRIVTFNVSLGDAPVNPDPEDPAEEILLDVADAADIQGETIDEVVGDDGKVKNGKRVQPLESLEINNYTFTFESGSNEQNAPAYYWPTSTNANGKKSIRIYNGNTMTVTAPAGVTFSSLVAIPDNSSTVVEIYKGESVNTYTFTATATTRINILKVGLNEGSTPEPPAETSGFYTGLETNADDWTLDVGEVPEGLNYVWSWDSKYGIKASAYYNNVRYATDIWAVSPVIDLTNADSAELKFSQAANFLSGNLDMISTAVREENGEWSTLTVDPMPAGNSWTYVDSSASLDAYVGKKIQIGFNYKSTDEVAATWEIKNLSVVGGIAAMIEKSLSYDGVAEYYTLQGVKVANPTNGLYIRIQNGKSQKIMVK